VGKTFTYVGKEVTHNMKLFRKQNLEGAFKNKNNIGKVLNIKKVAFQRTEYEFSGVYQLRCPDCNLVYTGQTGRQFKVRYHEHLWHLLLLLLLLLLLCLSPVRNKIGPVMGNIDDITRKRNRMEKYNVYLETNRDKQINDKNTVLRNRIFDILIHCESGRGLKRCWSTFETDKQQQTTSYDTGLLTTAQPSPNIRISLTTGNVITCPVLQAMSVQQSGLISSYFVSIFTGSPIVDTVDCGINRLYHLHRQLSTPSLNKPPFFNYF
jgi:hypothetical protein